MYYTEQKWRGYSQCITLNRNGVDSQCITLYRNGVDSQCITLNINGVDIASVLH